MSYVNIEYIRCFFKNKKNLVSLKNACKHWKKKKKVQLCLEPPKKCVFKSDFKDHAKKTFSSLKIFRIIKFQSWKHYNYTF